MTFEETCSVALSREISRAELHFEEAQDDERFGSRLVHHLLPRRLMGGDAVRPPYRWDMPSGCLSRPRPDVQEIRRTCRHSGRNGKTQKRHCRFTAVQFLVRRRLRWSPKVCGTDPDRTWNDRSNICLLTLRNEDRDVLAVQAIVPTFDRRRATSTSETAQVWLLPTGVSSRLCDTPIWGRHTVCHRHAVRRSRQ